MRFIENTDCYFIPVHRKTDVEWIHFLENTKYLATTKTWHIPKTELNRAIMQKKGFVQVINKPVIKPLPASLQPQLPSCFYDIQVEAVEFLYNRNGNALVSFDMGLGKTAISLLYTKLMKTKCVVIVCQASTKTQWAEQINQWVQSSSHIIYGRKACVIERHPYIIINYEILTNHVEVLKALKPDILIIDEVQFVSNTTATQTKAFTNLAMSVGRTIGLSGTPVSKSASQFFPILHVLSPTVFTDYYHYTKKFCDKKLGRYGWDVSGLSNVAELREHLANIMIRRVKADSIDIPQKIIIPVLFDMDKKITKTYVQEETRAITEVFGQGNYLNNKKSLTYLQYLAFLGKYAVMVDWIRDFLLSGKKLMLFCTNRKIVESLCTEFNAVKYYGGMSEKAKNKAKASFLADAQLIVGNTQAMGTGLDGFQHVCSNVGIVQLPFTPTALDQATDRIWRIGQSTDVNVFVFMAKKSIEQRIMRLLDRSRKQVEQLIDGKSVEQINMLSELVKSYKSA